jgi:hypothetical protein
MPGKFKLRVVLALVLALSAWAMVAVVSAGAASTPRAELRDLTCQRATDPPGRLVAITAVMRPVSGTERMALKSEIQRRVGVTGRFSVVRGRGLGQWIHPANPTLGQVSSDVWKFIYKVKNLSGPAYYRFRVWFRWSGSGGRVLSTASELSALCFQPEPRPDLAVRSITLTGLSGQRDRYVALVRNLGASAAGPFTIELQTPGSAPQSFDVESLSPGAGVRETFTGPACGVGGTVTATADPARQIDDANRRNNTLTVSCPS